MTNAQWFLLLGGLLLARGLTLSVLKPLPVTPAIIYLAVGLLVGPTVLNLFHFNPLKQSALLEVLTEVAVLISLFSAGVKMPVPVSFARWRTPILLASISMTVSVVLVAAFAYYLLGLPLGAGILLGAILAPTDPVLATDVQIRHPGDRDQLRFTLTCEAGMNDGSAFPFVVLGMGLLGLHELGEFGLRWVLVDVLWATVAGIAIGAIAGAALARLGWQLRGERPARSIQHGAGSGLEQHAIFGRHLVGAQQVDAAALVQVRVAAQANHQPVQLALQLQAVARFFVDADDDVDLDPAPLPVGVGAQHVAHQRGLFLAFQLDQQDGVIPGDPEAPQAVLPFMTGSQRLGRSA